MLAAQAASAALQFITEKVEIRRSLAKTFKEITGISWLQHSICSELEAGTVDAVAMDVGVAKYQVESTEIIDYVILDEKPWIQNSMELASKKEIQNLEIKLMLI